jgi:hypothetical protein
MPVSIDTGPFDESTDIRELIRSEPDAVEPGLRVLEVDLDIGEAGRVDLLAVDRHGALILLGIAARSPDDAMLRLLDAYRWAVDQHSLLVKAYGLGDDGPWAGTGHRSGIRLLLLAPGFTHAFLRRLPMLAVPITPLLARPLTVRGGARLLVEQAAPLFGLRVDGDRGAEPAPAEARAFEPAFASVDGGLRRKEQPLEDGTGTGRGDDHESFAEPPAIDAGVGSLLTPADRELFTETLTEEELEEFERFEHQRRGGDGGSE